jgi:hypothetical protein
MAARETKHKAQLAQLEAARRGKVASRAELDSFYTRLQVGVSLRLSACNRLCVLC